MSIFDTIRSRITLGRGNHQPHDSEGCVMEWVAVTALMESGLSFHEAWELLNDQPNCTHYSITRLAQSVNDRCSDDQRQDLIEFIPRLQRAGWTTDQSTQARVDDLWTALLLAQLAPALFAGHDHAAELTRAIDAIVELASEPGPWDLTHYDRRRDIGTELRDHCWLHSSGDPAHPVFDLCLGRIDDTLFSTYYAYVAMATQDQVPGGDADQRAYERAGIAFLDVALDCYDKARAHHGTLG